MSCCVNVLLAISALISFIAYKINQIFFRVPRLPRLENTWWGPGSSGEDNPAIEPFKIEVSDQVLEDLKRRLNETRPFVPPLEGIQQQYGMNTRLLSKIVDFWKNKYDWRESEKFLNTYPHFKTQIQGLNIHFVRVRPEKVDDGVEVVPLLLLNGWPSSVREYYGVIPLLTKPQEGRNFVFELIVPSLPGFGFSDAATKPGMGSAQIALIFKNLMERLGFKKFYVHGGDWGAIIAMDMTTLFPLHVLGLHSTLLMVSTPLSYLKTFLGSLWPSMIVEDKYKNRMYPLSVRYSSVLLESGYFHIQATKPDTVGVGLHDSPVGLAAYVLEKFTTGTNPQWKEREDGGLELKFTYTDLLDNVMIYWVTGCITTAMRLYAENMSKKQFALRLRRIPTAVPTACARFPYEISYQPDGILKEIFNNLVHSTHMEKGGHFAALEEPQLFADDIWSAVEKFRFLHRH